MIIFAYGADTFRSRRFVKELKDKFTRDIDPNAGSLSALDGQSATLKEINEQINTGSLFVKKRLVVIEDILKNKKNGIFAALTEYLKKFTRDTDNIIIFRDEISGGKENSLKAESKKLFNFLAKQPYSQEFPALSKVQLATFIRKEAAGQGKDIDPMALSLLIDLTGGDLWQIVNEIKKLTNYATAKIITAADVKKMVAGIFNENIFALTDALSARNKKMATDLLMAQYAAGASDEYLITMLIRQFKILLQVRSALDSGSKPAELSAKLKLHPFIAQKGIGQARNFTAVILKNYLNRLIRLDFSNKTGQGDIKTELVALIAGL
ncbi:MAG: DNA polymerase III subunit delta [Patescibacteria group bacterium]|jgi:DNA polymerase-3 subunit delta